MRWRRGLGSEMVHSYWRRRRPRPSALHVEHPPLGPLLTPVSRQTSSLRAHVNQQKDRTVKCARVVFAADMLISHRHGGPGLLWSIELTGLAVQPSPRLQRPTAPDCFRLDIIESESLFVAPGESCRPSLFSLPSPPSSPLLLPLSNCMCAHTSPFRPNLLTEMILVHSVAGDADDRKCACPSGLDHYQAMKNVVLRPRQGGGGGQHRNAGREDFLDALFRGGSHRVS